MRYLILLAVVITLACGRASAPATSTPAPATAVQRSAGVTYAPGQVRYRIVQRTHQEQLIEGNPRQDNYLLELLLTSTLARAAGPELTLSFTVDSVRAEGGLITSVDITRARSTRVTATMTPEGTVSQVSGDSAFTGGLQALGQGFRQFFPRVPPGGLQLGQAWSDTSETQTSGPTQLTIKTISDRRASEWTEMNGQRALHIVVNSRYTVTGGGQQMGQDFTIAGDGVRQGDQYLSAGGVYLGAVARDSSRVTVSLAAMGLSFPSIQIRHDSIAVAP